MANEVVQGKRFQGRAAKRTATGVAIVGVALAIFAAQFEWASLELPVNGAVQTLSVTGAETLKSLILLLLAATAAIVALMIVNTRIARIVISLLIVLLSGCAFAAIVTADVAQMFIDTVNSVTATSSEGAAMDAIAQGTISGSAWRWVAAAGTVIATLAGVYGLLTCASWPAGSHKYDRAAAAEVANHTGDNEPTDGERRPGTKQRAADRHIDQWDALSNGDDPTE